LYPGKESPEVDDKTLVRAASNQLDIVECRDLEVDASSINRRHAGVNPNVHPNRCGFQMLDEQASPNGRLAWLELLGNRSNRRGLKPMTENRRGQHRHAGILEAVGAMLGPDHLLETPFLTRADRLHVCHFTGYRSSPEIIVVHSY
jgi:hypothetical protein